MTATDTGVGCELLRDIAANPEDDGFRLIFMGWCEDNGQPERAAFIRGQRGSGPQVFINVRQFHEWFEPPVPVNLQQYRDRLNASACWPSPHEQVYRPADEPWNFSVEGGFLVRVEMSFAGWRHYGPMMAQSHPLMSVTLVDRKPYGPFPEDHLGHGIIPNDIWGWEPMTGEPEGELRKYLKGGTRRDSGHRDYPSKQLALDDMAQACIAWAREQPILR